MRSLKGIQYYKIFAKNFEINYFAKYLLMDASELCMIITLFSKFGKLDLGASYKLYCYKKVYNLKIIKFSVIFWKLFDIEFSNILKFFIVQQAQTSSKNKHKQWKLHFKLYLIFPFGGSKMWLIISNILDLYSFFVMNKITRSLMDIVNNKMIYLHKIKTMVKIFNIYIIRVKGYKSLMWHRYEITKAF